MKSTPKTDVQEGRLIFRFSHDWKVVKYDEVGQPYREGIQQQLSETAAVDFVAHHPSYGLFLLEVKDYRDDGKHLEDLLPSNRKDIAVNSNLRYKIAVKVRDSIAGIVGIFRDKRNQDPWKTFALSLTNLDSPITVILWLEENVTDRKRAFLDGIGEKELKKHLRWLTPNVMVVKSTSQALLKDLGIAVRYAPEA